MTIWKCRRYKHKAIQVIYFCADFGQMYATEDISFDVFTVHFDKQLGCKNRWLEERKKERERERERRKEEKEEQL